VEMAKNNDEKSIGYAIGKTNWYLKTLLNKLLREEKCGITNEQWLVLKVVDTNPAMSQTEISEKCQKDKTNITRIIDLLEKKGCIERRKDDRDRRMYRIHATDEGQKVLETVNPITQKTEKICTQSLNKKEVKEIINALDAICKNIKKEI
jgi:DNA-binding MarR family transcriptional regulator